MFSLRRIRRLTPLLCLAVAMNVQGQDEVITTRQDAVGRMLNAWAKEKSAAGLKLLIQDGRQVGPPRNHATWRKFLVIGTAIA